MMKGSIKWAVWLFLLVASFAVMEGYSLYDDTSTLSRFVWNVTAAFPPTPFIAGFLAGFLCCHFWWGGIVSFKPTQKTGSLVLFALLSAALIPATAHAATDNAGVIDIGQAFGQAIGPYINAIVQALIAALVSWVLIYIKKKTGIAIDAGHRDALVTALQNQAGSLIADGMVRVESGRITVPETALTKAANDALQAIPDAANHLGLTPDFVAKRIIDTIPQTAAGAAMIAATPAAAR